MSLTHLTLAGIQSFQLNRLQAVMNAAARLMFQSSRREHITPLLYRLHWLRAPQQIVYKHAVLVYQCLRGLAPAYMTDDLQPVAELPGRRRPTVIIDIGTGCTTDTPSNHRRPRVSDCSSKDLEQSAAGSDVITITPIF